MVSAAFRVSLPSKVADGLRAFRRHLPPLNFIVLHYIYYFTLCLLSAIVFWGSSTPAQSITFTDSLFLTVSAMTQAGLNTINLSQLNTWQQVILFFLILLGSSILISCAVVHTRKKAFEKRFATAIEEERKKRRALRSGISGPFPRALSRRRTGQPLVERPEVDGVVVRGRAIPNGNKRKPSDDQNNPGNRLRPERAVDAMSIDTRVANESVIQQDPQIEDIVQSPEEVQDQTSSTTEDENHIRFAEGEPKTPTKRPHRRIIHMSGVGARQDLENHPKSARTPRFGTYASQIRANTIEKARSTSRYFESEGFVGRNSQFHSLSHAEREKLGGVEYRALVLLEIIVVLYYVLWQMIGALGLAAWVAYNASSTTLQNGLNPWWVGAFLSVSAFNNNGMSLLDANMVAFQSSIYVLITSALLILAGNTCYPLFLRLILWTLYKILPEDSYLGEYKTTMKFLLDHPRRCYTTLFPSQHTWWLLAILVILNGIDWIAFEILNIGNEGIFTSQDAPRALDGLFQAFAVRSGGFYVVPIANLRIGLLVLYVLMMYVSVYPVTITIRNSNVYEERSLGIYADDPEAEAEEEKSKSRIPPFLSRFRRPAHEGSRSYFVRQQLRGQLAHDLWWICLAVLFITITETQSFGRDPVTFSVFNIVFETVSAYGCVGISTGAPNVAFSFCGEWHVLSKLILCAVMIRGRHRGLPVAIDRAVLLPGEDLGVAEEEDARVRREKTVERSMSRRRMSEELSHGNGTASV